MSQKAQETSIHVTDSDELKRRLKENKGPQVILYGNGGDTATWLFYEENNYNVAKQNHKAWGLNTPVEKRVYIKDHPDVLFVFGDNIEGNNRFRQQYQQQLQSDFNDGTYNAYNKTRLSLQFHSNYQPIIQGGGGQAETMLPLHNGNGPSYYPPNVMGVATCTLTSGEEKTKKTSELLKVHIDTTFDELEQHLRNGRTIVIPAMPDGSAALGTQRAQGLMGEDEEGVKEKLKERVQKLQDLAKTLQEEQDKGKDVQPDLAKSHYQYFAETQRVQEQFGQAPTAAKPVQRVVQTGEREMVQPQFVEPGIQQRSVLNPHVASVRQEPSMAVNSFESRAFPTSVNQFSKKGEQLQAEVEEILILQEKLMEQRRELSEKIQQLDQKWQVYESAQNQELFNNILQLSSNPETANQIQPLYEKHNLKLAEGRKSFDGERNGVVGQIQQLDTTLMSLKERREACLVEMREYNSAVHKMTTELQEVEQLRNLPEAVERARAVVQSARERPAVNQVFKPFIDQKTGRIVSNLDSQGHPSSVKAQQRDSSPQDRHVTPISFLKHVLIDFAEPGYDSGIMAKVILGAMDTLAMPYDTRNSREISPTQIDQAINMIWLRLGEEPVAEPADTQNPYTYATRYKVERDVSNFKQAEKEFLDCDAKFKRCYNQVEANYQELAKIAERKAQINDNLTNYRTYVDKQFNLILQQQITSLQYQRAMIGQPPLLITPEIINHLQNDNGSQQFAIQQLNFRFPGFQNNIQQINEQYNNIIQTETANLEVLGERESVLTEENNSLITAEQIFKKAADDAHAQMVAAKQVLDQTLKTSIAFHEANERKQAYFTYYGEVTQPPQAMPTFARAQNVVQNSAWTETSQLATQFFAICNEHLTVMRGSEEPKAESKSKQKAKPKTDRSYYVNPTAETKTLVDDKSESTAVTEAVKVLAFADFILSHFDSTSEQVEAAKPQSARLMNTEQVPKLDKKSKSTSGIERKYRDLKEGQYLLSQTQLNEVIAHVHNVFDYRPFPQAWFTTAYPQTPKPDTESMEAKTRYQSEPPTRLYTLAADHLALIFTLCPNLEERHHESIMRGFLDKVAADYTANGYAALPAWQEVVDKTNIPWQISGELLYKKVNEAMQYRYPTAFEIGMSENDILIDQLNQFEEKVEHYASLDLESVIEAEIERANGIPFNQLPESEFPIPPSSPSDSQWDNSDFEEYKDEEEYLSSQEGSFNLGSQDDGFGSPEVVGMDGVVIDSGPKELEPKEEAVEEDNNYSYQVKIQQLRQLIEQAREQQLLLPANTLGVSPASEALAKQICKIGRQINELEILMQQAKDNAKQEYMARAQEMALQSATLETPSLFAQIPVSNPSLGTAIQNVAQDTAPILEEEQQTTKGMKRSNTMMKDTDRSRSTVPEQSDRQTRSASTERLKRQKTVTIIPEASRQAAQLTGSEGPTQLERRNTESLSQTERNRSAFAQGVTRQATSLGETTTANPTQHINTDDRPKQ